MRDESVLDIHSKRTQLSMLWLTRLPVGTAPEPIKGNRPAMRTIYQ